MSTSIVTENSVLVQTKTIEIAGHCFQIAKVTACCWLLTDLSNGDVKQFAEAAAMWRFIGTIKSFVPDLSTPQLPANVPAYPRNARVAHRMAARAFSDAYPRSVRTLPTRGIIALPASTTPEPPKPTPAPLTKAQARAREEFLDQAERYFRLVTEVTHAKVSNYTRDNYEWKISNARLATGQAASRFEQFCSQGI
jgi:hypothetical protein